MTVATESGAGAVHDLTLDANGDWLAPAVRWPSPNCDPRPSGTLVDLVIIHGISLPPGRFGSGCVQQLFCNELDWDSDPYFKEIMGLKVSSHLLIERTGTLHQFVPLRLRAWHAGESLFAGRQRCNDFSIGIELEGTDDTAYADRQYQSLNAVLHVLMARLPGITAERIVGHSDVAPGRKTDPGPAFDWRRVEARRNARHTTAPRAGKV